MNAAIGVGVAEFASLPVGEVGGNSISEHCVRGAPAKLVHTVVGLAGTGRPELLSIEFQRNYKRVVLNI